MPRVAKARTSADPTANLGFAASVPARKDLRADTATRVTENPQPRSHWAGLLHGARQPLANPPFNDSDTALRDSARPDREAHLQDLRGAKASWSKDDEVRCFSLSASNGERAGVRCRILGTPPKGNANFAWVPPAARWSYLQNSAKQPTIGKIVDDAMVAIERDNARLKGVLPKDYARPALDKHRLGELIDLIATISLTAASEGEKTHRSVDLLGRVYEYFLTRFASAEGKNGGQFYTPSCVVRLLVEMLAPHPNSRIYDPCCGSGGMFVQSEKFVESHGGKLGDISVYGQESNATTRRLAIMNLAIRGIEADFGPEHADTFRRDLHPDLRADTATRVSAKPRPRGHSAGLLRSERQLLANPPFNDSDWFRKDDDVRWQFGVPPKGNANFAWVQHFIHQRNNKENQNVV